MRVFLLKNYFYAVEKNIDRSTVFSKQKEFPCSKLNTSRKLYQWFYFVFTIKLFKINTLCNYLNGFL